MPENTIAPVWLDYKKDIQRSKSGPYDVLAVQNKDNALFRLYYQYETGSWANKYLPVAVNYLEYLGTQNKTAEEFSTDFYKIASSWNVTASGETTTISIDGLQDNFNKAVSLFQDLLQNCKVDEDALAAYKMSMKKSRTNKKLNKGAIMSGLRNYAMYGAQNPFNNELTDAELDALTGAQLVAILHDLADFQHRILYYGPKTASEIGTQLVAVHKAPATFKPLPAAKKFDQLTQDKNQVLFANYDMVQAEVFWIRNSDVYNAKEQPTISMFNEYFGGGMGSIVFQTIRESKALAYSTYAAFNLASREEYRNSALAYVGTQADKFNEAVTGMNELLNDLPESQKAMETAKDGLRKSLATDRITQEGILFNYLTAQRMGRDYDIRKNTYDATAGFTFADLKSFHSKELSNKPYTYCIVANQDKLKEDDMKKLGAFRKLTLEEIFGY